MAKIGRPKIELTEEKWKIAENMAKIQCTGVEIADVMGFSYDTLERRVKARYGCSFAEWHKKYSNHGKTSLRRMQWKSAEEGNVTMQIFLGKNLLGQSEQQAVDVTFENLTPLAEMLKEDADD